MGERGISVSGGQKARIALARAVYSDADLCVLDDPLSAVDAHVGAALFFDCIARALKGRGKGVVLATHQTQYLPYADKVLVLSKGGEQVYFGTYAELKGRPDVLAMVSSTKEDDCVDHDAPLAADASGASAGRLSAGDIGVDLIDANEAAQDVPPGARYDVTRSQRGSSRLEKSGKGAAALAVRAETSQIILAEDRVEGKVRLVATASYCFDTVPLTVSLSCLVCSCRGRCGRDTYAPGAWAAPPSR